MRLEKVNAIAATVEVELGEESKDSTGIQIRNRTFRDRVQSNHFALTGRNTVTVNLDIGSDGSGVLQASFQLESESADGRWVGQLSGCLENGLVVARGLARGEEAFDGFVISIDYRQVPDDPGFGSLDDVIAYYRMEALLLVDD